MTTSKKEPNPNTILTQDYATTVMILEHLPDAIFILDSIYRLGKQNSVSTAY